jgi:MFS family permease
LKTRDDRAEGGAADDDGAQRSTNRSLLWPLSLGHGAIHWFQQLYPMILPAIKGSLGLSDIQVGTLSAVRQFGTGPLLLPGGILADFKQHRMALILAASFLFMGLSYFLVSLATSYTWILLTVGLIGIGTVLWHPAALGTLARRFPDRKGFALGVHGVGASVADTLAPVAIGGLLAVLAWQDLLKLHLIPAVILAFLVWRSFGAMLEQGKRPTISVKAYLDEIAAMVRRPVVLGVLGVTGFTSMARLSVITFLPIYLKEDLGYSPFIFGVYLGLLHAMGGLSQPVMGYLSDRFGRKAVLMPSLIVFGLLYFALAAAAPGVQLTLVILALGLFFYALANIIQATIMDAASANVQSSTMGVTGIFGQFFSLPGPIIAGVIVAAHGRESAFIFAGAVTLLAALLLAPIKIPKSSTPTPRGGG